jgi:hypothetical protein
MSQELTITLPSPGGSEWTKEAIDGLVGKHLDFTGQPGVGPVAMCMEIKRGYVAEDDPTLAVMVVEPHLTVAKVTTADPLSFQPGSLFVDPSKVKTPEQRIRELEQEVADARLFLAAIFKHFGTHEIRLDRVMLQNIPRDFLLKRWDDNATGQVVVQLLAGEPS